jgi:hypothetical protein
LSWLQCRGFIAVRLEKELIITNVSYSRDPILKDKPKVPFTEEKEFREIYKFRNVSKRSIPRKRFLQSLHFRNLILKGIP